MKKYLLIFPLLFFSFLICSGVFASEEMSIRQDMGNTRVNMDSFSTRYQNCQTFTASSTNISRVATDITDGTCAGNSILNVCETASLTTYTCLGDLYTSNSTVYLGTPSYLTDFTFASDVPTIIGHYYRLCYATGPASCSIDIAGSGGGGGHYYESGRLIENVDYDWQMNIYYNTSYAPPVSENLILVYPFGGASYSSGVLQTFAYSYENPDSFYINAAFRILNLDNNITTDVLETLSATSSASFTHWNSFTLQYENAGTKTFDLNLPAGNYSFMGALVGTSTNDILLSSPNTINFSVASSSDFSFASSTFDWTHPLPFASTSTLFSNTNNHDLVCSAAEWASSTWTCQIEQGFMNFISMISKLASNSVSTFQNGLIGVFPFNLPLKVWTSWNDSANGALPEELGFIDSVVDADGDVYVNIPNFSTASTTEYMIFGHTLLAPPDSMAADFFAWLRVMSKYIMWALFILAIINFGRSLYNEINGVAEVHADTKL